MNESDAIQYAHNSDLFFVKIIINSNSFFIISSVLNCCTIETCGMAVVDN
jgi:hypothetical protein